MVRTSATLQQSLDREMMSRVVATFLFQHCLDPLQFGFGQMFDADKIVARIVHGADQFVQLRLDR